jgi:hypothetical protein
MRLPRPASLLLPFVVLSGCRPAPVQVDVIATNYAFAAPKILSPGPTLFRLMNRGTVRHEVQLYRFTHSISADSGMRLLADSTAADSLFDSGGSVLIAAPGDTAPEAIYADLKIGETWILECAFRDSASAPRHNKMGMISVLEVR